jgi:MFS family permease
MGAVASSTAAFAVAQQKAGWLNSLLPFSAMIATPLFGLLADRIGKRAGLMVIGSFLMMPVYLMIAYSSISLLVPVSLMGIAFSLIPAVMWPSVAYIVDERRLGTAYALMSLLQQIGFFIFNLAIGKANDISHAGPTNFGGYALGMWIFSILGFLALLFALLLRQRETGPNAHGLETITTHSHA